MACNTRAKPGCGTLPSVIVMVYLCSCARESRTPHTTHQHCTSGERAPRSNGRGTHNASTPPTLRAQAVNEPQGAMDNAHTAHQARKVPTSTAQAVSTGAKEPWTLPTQRTQCATTQQQSTDGERSQRSHGHRTHSTPSTQSTNQHGTSGVRAPRRHGHRTHNAQGANTTLQNGTSRERAQRSHGHCTHSTPSTQSTHQPGTSGERAPRSNGHRTINAQGRPPPKSTTPTVNKRDEAMGTAHTTHQVRHRPTKQHQR